MKHLLTVASLAVALWLPAGPVSADQLEDAVAAYESSNYETALKLFLPLAEQGNATAQNRLGVMYRFGQGVRRDYAEAAKWFRLAGEQGHAEAQNWLGFLHAQGMGVAKDYAEAVKWRRLSAVQGNANAQDALAGMYDSGRGVPRDYAKAAKWTRLAAEQGHRLAMFGLGLKLHSGVGVPENKVEALMWSILANNVDGDEYTAAQVEKITAELTPEQVADAQKLASAWKPKTWDELKEQLPE